MKNRISELEVSNCTVKGEFRKYSNFKKLLNNTDGDTEYQINSEKSYILVYPLKGNVTILLPKINHDNMVDYSMKLKESTLIYENKLPYCKRYTVIIQCDEESLIENIDGSLGNKLILENISTSIKLKCIPKILENLKNVWFIENYHPGIKKFSKYETDLICIKSDFNHMNTNFI